MVPFMVMLFGVRDFPRRDRKDCHCHLPGRQPIHLALIPSCPPPTRRCSHGPPQDHGPWCLDWDLPWCQRGWRPRRLDSGWFFWSLCGLLGLANIKGPQAKAWSSGARRSGAWPGWRLHWSHLELARGGGRLSDHSLPNLVQRLNAPCCGDLGRPGLSDRLGGTGRIHIGRSGVEGLPTGSVGYIYLPALVALASASVLTAPWGARMAHRTDVSTLRRWFAVLLFCLAAYMLTRVDWW